MKILLKLYIRIIPNKFITATSPTVLLALERQIEELENQRLELEQSLEMKNIKVEFGTARGCNCKNGTGRSIEPMSPMHLKPSISVGYVFVTDSISRISFIEGYISVGDIVSPTCFKCKFKLIWPSRLISMMFVVYKIIVHNYKCKLRGLSYVR